DLSWLMTWAKKYWWSFLVRDMSVNDELYAPDSTLEPCSERATTTRLPCTDRVLAVGIPRVVIAWREPATFVADCVGVEKLEQSGVEVVELRELAEAAMAMNRHLDLR
ncbi:hypothetical protein ACH49Y_24065, partial [Nocardia farcinica]